MKSIFYCRGFRRFGLDFAGIPCYVPVYVSAAACTAAVEPAPGLDARPLECNIRPAHRTVHQEPGT